MTSKTTFLPSSNRGGGQKLHNGRGVLPVADNSDYFFGSALLDIWPKDGIEDPPVASKTEEKYNHLKMLSATGRTCLLVRSFCPPPVVRPSQRNTLGIAEPKYLEDCRGSLWMFVTAPHQPDYNDVDGMFTNLTKRTILVYNYSVLSPWS